MTTLFVSEAETLAKEHAGETNIDACRDPEYAEAANKVKERLQKTTERPKKNSVLDCIRFHTRQEHLDDYYCLACNDGILATQYALDRTCFIVHSVCCQLFLLYINGIFTALQALHMLLQIRPSVRPFVRHTPVLCQNDGTQRDAVFTVG